MIIKTTCLKCGVTIRLDFGDMTKEQALESAEKMDNTPRECPGMHVELGGFRTMWQLDDAIRRAFDLGESEPDVYIPTDKEYVEALSAEGREIIDGGSNTVPELNLLSIHSFADLVHMGFGDFRSETHLFLRCDSPRRTRFYEMMPRHKQEECAVSSVSDEAEA